MSQKARPPITRITWIIGGLVTIAWLAIYLLTVSPTVNFIDSGELITAVHEPGIVHPPGYPLYTLLGYVASHVPVGEVAWRVNVFSSFFGALAVGAMFLLLTEIANYTKSLLKKPQSSRTPPGRKPQKSAAQKQAARKPAPQQAAMSAVQPAPETPLRIDWTALVAAVAGASLLGAASTFWNRSTQAKMYTLHYFFMLALFLIALEYRWAYERGQERIARRWLIALAAGLGLSLTNHLMTTLLIPGLALLVIWGRGSTERSRSVFKQWKLVVPALVLPLLLYLYLPLRSAQVPIMNWGSPSNLPDFWRHITAWQYRAYFQNDFSGNIERLWGFVNAQWGWLSLPLMSLGIVAAAVLAVKNLPVLLATGSLAVLTIIFSLAYGISEIEPYLVPLYAMLIIWLASAPPLIDSLVQRPADAKQPGQSAATFRLGLPAAGLLAAVALVSAVLQFPRQNHSNDHLAELFVKNAFSGFEKDAIVLTDHWDFYSPAYYLQVVEGYRPDVVIIDKSTLRYPFYLGQLEERYPWLVANSKDIVDPFRVEQRKWVNGEDYNQPLLNQLYLNLLTSFVERNYDKHPTYTFFTSSCDAGAARETGAENNQIAPKYTRQPAGMAFRLWREPPPSTALPPEPQFDLRGYTYDKAPLDDFSRYNTTFYTCGYGATADAYARANQTDKANALASKAAELRTALTGR